MKTDETNKQTKTKMIKMQNCGAYSPSRLHIYKTVPTPKAQRALKKGTRWIIKYSQEIWEFAVKLCLLGISEALIKSP